MEQQEVWNKIAEKWNEYRSEPIEEVKDFLQDQEGKVLDLGCGSGRNMIPNPNIEYYEVDFSKNMLKLAEEKAKKENINAKFFNEKAEKLPFEDNFFDNALFISSLHCIKGNDNRKKALEELFRVLKKGCEAMISVWNKKTNLKLRKIKSKEAYIDWQGHERYYYLYDKEEIKELLRSVGFKLTAVSIADETKHSKKNMIFYVLKPRD